MPRPASASTSTSVSTRVASFVLERFPFALLLVQEALDVSGAARVRERDASAIESLRVTFRRELKRSLDALPIGDLPEPTPGVTAQRRIEAARRELLDACDGCLAREALAASLT